jgi:4'-phosphopantetheinyl transferase
MSSNATPPPRLVAGEVHLWFAFPDEPQLHDPELLEAYRGLMDAAERRRQERYMFARHRHQALVARALVRTTLSRYVPEVAPASWRFVEGKHGRPELADRSSGMRFNLSHTDGLMVCGVTLESDIGVDVEDARRRVSDTMGIANRFFAPAEVEQLSGDPRGRFFDFWTLKESYIKARGAGLSLPLRQFAFRLEEPEIRVSFDAVLQDDPRAWRFALLRPTPHHTAALAVRCPESLLARMGQVVPLRSEGGLACEVAARSPDRVSRTR